MIIKTFSAKTKRMLYCLNLMRGTGNILYLNFTIPFIREEEVPGPRKEFHIFFVPRKTLLCERKLKELGVYGTFSTIEEYSLEMFPFDSDLLSMEMEESFKVCFLFIFSTRASLMMYCVIVD